MKRDAAFDAHAGSGARLTPSFSGTRFGGALLGGALFGGALFGGAYAGRRVLVTGHTGFKGSWLALWLHAMGAEVCGLALPPEPGPNHGRLLQVPLKAALTDLRDATAVRAALRRFAPEIVFHLAAQPLVRRSYREPAATFDTNVMGLVNLLEAVRATPSVRVVVNATSDKCYANLDTACSPGDAGGVLTGDARGVLTGDARGVLTDEARGVLTDEARGVLTGEARGFVEADALGGHDPYSASKACAEIVSASYRASFLATDDGRGQPVALATARAGNVVGGGDWSEDRLIPDLVRAAVSGRHSAIRYPHATRPWQHVLEPLAGYLLLGQHLLTDPQASAEAWNFGPDAACQWPVAQVVAAFAEHWPAVRSQLDPSTPLHEAAQLRLDCGKAQARLGWVPLWNAATTFERTALWYRHQHEQGGLRSREDLLHYVADARIAGLAWAA